jgi:hypothetical protein
MKVGGFYMATTYDDSRTNLLAAIDNLFTAIETKFNSVSTKEENFDGNQLALENNTIFVYNGSGGVKTLNITYPSGNFISTILFSTASSGPISIKFPSNTRFVGSAPYEFFNGENWELNIHNGIVVGSTIT